MNSTVSVIIPCYNHGQFLEETIQSVLNSDYKSIEIIIVDDGSTDGSSEVALNLAFQNPDQINVIMQENQGPSAARNRGIESSTGPYILCLDGDDRIGPTYISNAVQILDAQEDVKVVYCHAEKFGEKTGPWNLKPFSRSALALDNMIFISAMFRKEDWQAIGGFDPRFTKGWEDWEFWINLLKSGGKVIKLPEIGFYYRIRGVSRRKSTKSVDKQNTIEILNTKHQDFFKQYLGGPIRNPRSWSIGINRMSNFFGKVFKT
jgi:glycosyltransferase involved in cell wall biosynthesis